MTNVSISEIILIISVYFSSTIPWALIIGKIRLKDDIRNYGDKNPGTVNVFRAGSILWGFISAFLEISKSAIPIIFAIKIFNISEITMLACVLAALLGHGYSPLLNFKGGKSLAVTAGSWLAITGGEAFYIIAPSLLIMKIIQKNDALTSTIGFASLFFYILIRNPTAFSTESLLIGILLNLIFIIFKHRNDYALKVNFRSFASND